MTITLMSNTSPANYVTKNVSTVETLTGTLREPSSITDPVFMIERASPTGFNYIQIPEFSRYYYVTGVSSEHNNLIAIACHVDVLMSYANQIRAFKAIIKRQENQYNLYLDDGIFKAYQNPKHKIMKLPYGFTQYSYILALAGNQE